MILVDDEVWNLASQYGLEKKLNKQLTFLVLNLFHPSLHTEILEPRKLRIWSFRVDKKHRALFYFDSERNIRIFQLTKHYQ